MFDADGEEAFLAAAFGDVLAARAQVGLGQCGGDDALQGVVAFLGHQCTPTGITVAAQAFDLGRRHPQLQCHGRVGRAALDRAIALKQDENQQFQVAFGQRLKALQQGQPQELIAECGRVLQFDSVHRCSPMNAQDARSLWHGLRRATGSAIAGVLQTVFTAGAVGLEGFHRATVLQGHEHLPAIGTTEGDIGRLAAFQRHLAQQLTLR
ncbi:hypothetical protein D3C71_1409110 [compost metagenome]